MAAMNMSTLLAPSVGWLEEFPPSAEGPIRKVSLLLEQRLEQSAQ